MHSADIARHHYSITPPLDSSTPARRHELKRVFRSRQGQPLGQPLTYDFERRVIWLRTDG